MRNLTSLSSHNPTSFAHRVARTALYALGILALCTTGAQAQPEAKDGREGKSCDMEKRAHGHHGRRGHGPGKMLARMDLNRDGDISRDEAQQARTQMFTELDTDQDGSLSREELKAGKRKMHGKRLEERFERLDTNGDGSLTQEEAGFPEQRFTRMDLNGDGLLTLEEMREARKQWRAERQAKAGEKGKARKHGKKGRHGKGFARMDADGDGNLSQAESEAALEKLFNHLDKNNDGVITKEERKEARAAHRGKHGRRGGKHGKKGGKGQAG